MTLKLIHTSRLVPTPPRVHTWGLDTDLRPHLARYLSSRWTRFHRLSRRWISRQDDIEALHDLRVTARELLSILRLFREHVPRKQRRATMDFLKLTLRETGPIREDDLFLDFIRSSVAGMPPEDRTFVLLVQTRITRERAEAAVPAVDLLFRADRLTPPSPKVGDRLVTGILMSEIVPRQYAKFVDTLREALSHPRNAKSLHRARLSGKPLRYALDFLKPALRPQVRKSAEAVKEIIRLLGHIHDCDTAMVRLRKARHEAEIYGSLAPGKAPVLSAEGIVQLLGRQTETRDNLVAALLKLVSRWDDRNLARYMRNPVLTPVKGSD